MFLVNLLHSEHLFVIIIDLDCSQGIIIVVDIDIDIIMVDITITFVDICSNYNQKNFLISCT